MIVWLCKEDVQWPTPNSKRYAPCVRTHWRSDRECRKKDGRRRRFDRIWRRVKGEERLWSKPVWEPTVNRIVYGSYRVFTKKRGISIVNSYGPGIAYTFNSTRQFSTRFDEFFQSLIILINPMQAVNTRIKFFRCHRKFLLCHPWYVQTKRVRRRLTALTYRAEQAVQRTFITITFTRASSSLNPSSTARYPRKGS